MDTFSSYLKLCNLQEVLPKPAGTLPSLGDCFSIDFVMSERRLSNRTLNLASSVLLVFSKASR